MFRPKIYFFIFTPPLPDMFDNIYFRSVNAHTNVSQIKYR
jgi:hypothetical protein